MFIIKIIFLLSFYYISCNFFFQVTFSFFFLNALRKTKVNKKKYYTFFFSNICPYNFIKRVSTASVVSSFLLKTSNNYLDNWSLRRHGNRPRNGNAYLKAGSTGRWRSRDKPQRTTVFFRSSRQLLNINFVSINVKV